jgi:hypothetical protein
MSEKPGRSPIALPGDVQLNCVNAHVNPHSNIYSVFILTGRLARRAVDTALEIQKLPGVEIAQIEPVLNFWYRLADYARTAALNCAGGNQTLAEALITYQFLQTAAEEESDAR